MDDVFVIVLILFGANQIVFFFNRTEKYKGWLHSKKALSILFLWSFLGLLAGLDQSNAFGCVISPVANLTNKNSLLSTLSIGLIFMAYRIENTDWQVFLGIGEALFWVAKLFLFKGGYAVGFGGSLDFSILLYDTLSIYIRLFALGLAVNQLGFSLRKISIVTFIIMAIKVSFFARPAMMVYEDRVLETQAQNVRNQMLGEWTCFVKGSGEHKRQRRDGVVVSIDSNHILFKGIPALGDQYQFQLDSPKTGRLLGTTSYEDLFIYIRYLSSDSLSFELNAWEKTYSYKLVPIEEN